MSRIAFHRPVRLAPPRPPAEKIVLPAPPQARAQPGAALWTSLLLPLMSSVTMAAYLIAYRQAWLIAMAVGFVLVSVGITFLVRHQMRGEVAKAQRRLRERYFELLADARSRARAAAALQLLASAWVHPAPERLWAVAARRRRVWERRAADPDFLAVRFGVGRGPALMPVQVGPREDPMAEYDPRILAAARRLAAASSTVRPQAAVVDLARAGVVSLLGPAQRTRALARAVLCQIAVLHDPEAVTIAVVSGGGDDWDWVKWLPHNHEPGAAGPAGPVPLLAARFEGLADYFEQELARPRRPGSAMIPAAAGPTLNPREAVGPARRLVVLIDSYDPGAPWARGPLAAALLDAAGPRSGITVLCLVDAEQDEPTVTRVRARVGADGALSIEALRPDSGGSGIGANAGLGGAVQVDQAVADRLEPVLADRIARRLAPLRLTDEPERLLTQVVSMPKMIGVEDIGAYEPAETWAGLREEALLRVPIGIGAEGEPVHLDLKESALDGMGPHGLVVGATGSGKSELLRTLVGALAATHPPEKLSLVLVDFKGGATFAGVTALPHVAGLVTNLSDDPTLVDRFHAALRGEQQRRQRLLRDAGNADSLHAYQRKRAAGALDVNGRPLEPLPYLVVIVDEFGELLAQRPDFIAVFVQIGRLGRSLGMHLLLATQRLDEGRLRGLDSHLSYRICLRTFSAAESRMVIGSTDAYQLPPLPGSAYLKVSAQEPVRLRVAHVSAPYQPPESDRHAGRLRPVLFGPRPDPDDAMSDLFDSAPADADAYASADAFAQPGGSAVSATVSAAGGPTELEVLVERLDRGAADTHQVWLPPLPPAITLDSLLDPIAAEPGLGLRSEARERFGELSIPIGVVDLPEEQVQLPYCLDTAGASGNLAVVGAPQSGKSTLVRTFLLSAMITHTPQEAQFYCLDFGGGSLQPFERAPHVGAVAGRRDPDRVRQVLSEVRRLVERREKLLGELGLDSVAAFRELRRDSDREDRGNALPGGSAADVFLVIDGWGALRAELEQADAMVADIAVRGLGVGVHVVVTANRWADIRMNLRDSLAGRVELRLNDPGESEVGRAAARALGAAVPGRGIAPPGVVYHVALPRLDGRTGGEGLAQAQQEALDKIAAAWSGPAAAPVRMLPALVRVSELPRPEPVASAAVAGSVAAQPDERPSMAPGGPAVPVGLGERDLAPVSVHLPPDDPHLLVFGDAGSGKSTFLRTWMQGLAERTTPWQVRFMVVDYRRTLAGCVDDSYLGAYAGDQRAAASYAAALRETLDARLPPPGTRVRGGQDRDWWQGPELFLVVDDYDLVASGRDTPLACLTDHLAHARDTGFHVIVARGVAGSAKAAMSDAFGGRIRDLGAGALILSGDPREGALVGARRAAQRPPGRGELVGRRGEPVLLQVAVGEGDEPAGDKAAGDEPAGAAP